MARAEEISNEVQSCAEGLRRRCMHLGIAIVSRLPLMNANPGAPTFLTPSRGYSVRSGLPRPPPGPARRPRERPPLLEPLCIACQRRCSVRR